MIEGFTEEKNDCCCCAAVKPKMTWEELKEFSKKYGAEWVDDNIQFGYLEFIENGEVMWYGEIICPDRTYEQMAGIIENMFGE